LLNLTKITTKYNELEDRVSITGLASNESVVELWASRRILIRLIPPIANWLDETKNTAPRLDNKSKKLLNDFSQHEAKTELKPEKPVNLENPNPISSGSSSNSWLIQKIDVTYSGEFMELSFRNKNDSAAKLVLTKLYARQWLLILHSQWMKSEWPMDIWPLWLSQPSVSAEHDLH
jgi:hypothetical protein